ncbi:GDP-Man:Man(3)GlcNAc(2)-PP-Dol alpha-1,2-mannosyltransferase-like [Phymastichus coffea]|uniref:GDP-Man:Man(3)GlcNAc(2)-PP-Dol alpha-1,2-mannosyltransferase-like n=1 Tax=Phymastichus coffea TaxID=108790 RepID=UPI00273BE5BF|nr:GDP-Man:Man(3)GlcNAc(2)-PP-Dol alpha-1,2-mannosyltransferase-like [Phymastichus coffea]
MAQMGKKITYWIYEKLAFAKVFLIFWILLCPLIWRILRILFSRKYVDKRHKKDVSIAFFHPNCNACTPQENVLWSAVKAIQVEYDNVRICVYTGDLKLKGEDILANVESKFDIKLQPNIKIVYLRHSKWIKTFAYMGSIWVGSEALVRLKPHILIDTMGYGYINLIFKRVGTCKVINYIHNPLVTLEKLKTRYIVLTDNQYILTRRPPSALGISKGIASIYGWTGRMADLIMVNSYYTKEQIDGIWQCPDRTHILYPPIGLEKLMIRADGAWDKKSIYRIINASVFKEESNHELILQALYKLRSMLNPTIMNEVRLILVNLSTEEDESYINNLKNLVQKYNLSDFVKIYHNYIHANRLEEELIRSSYGIYAKVDDHFGSDIIAGLATGQIMIVHNSGAAKNELIDNDEDSQNGYLAKTAEEYAKALKEALQLTPAEKRKMQKAARRTAEQFSRLYFQKKFLELIESVFETK